MNYRIKDGREDFYMGMNQPYTKEELAAIKEKVKNKVESAVYDEPSSTAPVKITFDVKAEDVETLDAPKGALESKGQYFNAGTSTVVCNGKDVKPGEVFPSDISAVDIAKFTLNGSLGKR